MASDAAEVAEDYRHALEDLSSNMRFEISNLTVIARENTEHALTIAEVLQQHILKVGLGFHPSPRWKRFMFPLVLASVHLLTLARLLQVRSYQLSMCLIRLLKMSARHTHSTLAATSSRLLWSRTRWLMHPSAGRWRRC